MKCCFLFLLMVDIFLCLNVIIQKIKSVYFCDKMWKEIEIALKKTPM